MKHLTSGLAVAAAFCLASMAAPASAADPLKNIVLVHGAWVDASGWKPVYEILSKDGFHVTMVQEPETSFADDVAATKRILDLQDGPTLLVGHSYGGSIITQAGVHPSVVGLVYVAAHAPDVGEDEAALGKKTPSMLAKTESAIKKTPDRLSQPGRLSQAVCARSAARAGGVRGALSGAGRGQGFRSDAADGSRLEEQAELGNRRRRRQDHQPRSRALVLRAGQEPHDRDQGRQPLGLQNRIQERWRP